MARAAIRILAIHLILLSATGGGRVEAIRRKQQRESSSHTHWPQWLGGSALYVDRSGVPHGENMEYSDVPIPIPADVEEWKTSLMQVPTADEGDVAPQVDYTMRFCALAYARNAPAAPKYVMLSSNEAGTVDVIELQFHGTDTWWAGAHVVVYLYKLKLGGVGVVLAYKGSTLNLEDWRHNLYMLTLNGERLLDDGVQLFNKTAALKFPDTDLPKSQVMHGFQQYEETLSIRMAQFDMTPLKSTLLEWGATADASNFHDWLHSDAWSWCINVGHSLGGAMAKISAVEIAALTGKKTFLATVGAPTAGDKDHFQQAQKNITMPGGGLRIYHYNDPVPFAGYLGTSVLKTWFLPQHEGMNVAMWPRSLSPLGLHLYYDIPTTVRGNRELVRFIFPSLSYTPNAEHDSTNFKFFKVVKTGGSVDMNGNGGTLLGHLDRLVQAYKGE